MEADLFGLDSKINSQQPALTFFIVFFIALLPDG
jgi:hypothetical protein